MCMLDTHIYTIWKQNKVAKNNVFKFQLFKTSSKVQQSFTSLQSGNF